MEGPIITTSEGKLQGTALRSILGTYYWAFKGIPFAQPPLGPLRFKAPQEPLKWTEIRDASKHAGDIAIQKGTADTPKFRDIMGGEDCLYLNVYTNAIGHKRPVMFFIHGGGFIEGSGNEIFYRQDYLVTKDMVLVCVNYRVGPFGFLNLGDEVAPGNQGLRDIISALKWVQRNIEAFGGDPRNVTVFGSSSGSIACHILSMSPTAKGLFSKAILQSGTIFMVKNVMTENNFKNGFKLASLLGMDSNDPVKVIEFLRTVPAKDLVALQGKLLTKYETDVLFLKEYGPIVDADYTSDPIIPLSISKLSKNDAHVPMMIGHTSHEYLLSLAGQFNDETYQYYNDNIEEIVRNNLLLRDDSHFTEIIKTVREFYLKNKPINKDAVWNLVNLMSDLTKINANRKIIDERNEHAKVPTYVYKFSYKGNQPTIYHYDHGRQPLDGVAHADELSYMFYLYCADDNEDQFPKKGTKDERTMERLLRMWYNFALTGNPTPELDDRYITTTWKPSTKENLNYLDIDDELTLQDDKDSESRAIYEKYSSLIMY